MLTTANPEYDRKFRLWRQHSMSVADTVRHGARQVIFESYPEAGFNYRMTDLQAAVGRVQLSRLEEVVAERRALAARYAELLADIPGVRLPGEPAWARSNWQSYCVRLPEGCDQRAVMQSMLEENISTRRGVMCSHLEEAYRHAPETAPFALPESERAQSEGVILPLFSAMSEDDQQRVRDGLSDAVARHR